MNDKPTQTIQQYTGENKVILTPITLMSTRVDILCFISTCITPDNQLLKVKYVFNLETVSIYVGT